MRKWLRRVGFTALLLAASGALLGFAYRENLGRLIAATTLFEADKIVANFSGMDRLFLSKTFPLNGDVEEWPEAPAALPESFEFAGRRIAVDDFLKQTATTSVLVVRDGVIEFEQYYLGTGRDDLRISWSMAKSFLSAVFGIAVKEGKIASLDDAVTDYVPALKGSAYDGVSIRNTLNMATGVKFNEDYLDFWSDINAMGRTLALGTSMDAFAASIKERVREQGVMRQYTSIDTHVLAMVLRAATGRSLIDLVAEQIVEPIGFERTPYYVTDGYGVEFALAGLNITTRDYARFGQMFLDHGMWDGRQVIPRDWVEESIKATAPAQSVRNDGFGYGYQWWIPPGAADGEFMARGIYDQYIYMDRASRTVIVKTSANRGFREDGVLEATLAMLRAIARR